MQTHLHYNAIYRVAILTRTYVNVNKPLNQDTVQYGWHDSLDMAVDCISLAA